MSNKSIIIGAGLLTMFTISVTKVPMESKVYSSGTEYYVGDNKAEIKVANDSDRTITGDRDSDDEFSCNAPDTFQKPDVASESARANLVLSDNENAVRFFGNKDANTVEAFKQDLIAHMYTASMGIDDAEEYLKDASDVTLMFSYNSSLFCPLDDCHVESVQPSTGTGEITNFDSYFKDGNGVTVTIQSNKPVTVGSISNKYVRITYSYLNSFWSSGTDDSTKCKKVGTDKALPYTDWTEANKTDYQLDKYYLIGYAGATGSAYNFAKGNAYVRVALQTSENESSGYQPVPIAHLYGFQ